MGHSWPPTTTTIERKLAPSRHRRRAACVCVRHDARVAPDDVKFLAQNDATKPKFGTQQRLPPASDATKAQH
jgi:hypothetical protein